jgi:hypothetical protein
LTVLFFELTGGAHRVNQIIGCVDSGQRWWEGSRVEAIAFHNLGVGSDARSQEFRASGQTANWPSSFLEPLQEASSDVACGSSQQDERPATRISY